MSIETNLNRESNGPTAARLPDWADCDYFCIHGYAATTTPSCGWRGRSHDALRDPADLRLRCPRCGCATLLRIPLDRAEETIG
jgi:hypothetical protein